jgi:hypothetical protein
MTVKMVWEQRHSQQKWQFVCALHMHEMQLTNWPLTYFRVNAARNWPKHTYLHPDNGTQPGFDKVLWQSKSLYLAVHKSVYWMAGHGQTLAGPNSLFNRRGRELLAADTDAAFATKIAFAAHL